MAAAAALASPLALAQEPIRLIVPYAPGGPIDITARALAERVRDSLGVVIIDNRAGAGGNIGADAIARATPDGLTIGISATATHAVNPWLYTRMPYDAGKDFAGITQMVRVPNVLVMNAARAEQLKIHSVADLIAYAKANPGKLNYASAGSGSTNHLSAVLFEKAAGINMFHVPYKGGAPAVLDTVANQTQVLFSAGTQTLPHVKSGKLRLLGVTEAKRSKLLPDAPAVAETLPGYELGVWYGLFGPVGMPKDLVQRLNEETNKALADPAVRARMDSIGVEIIQATPQQFATVLRSDAERYGKIIRDLDIKSE